MKESWFKFDKFDAEWYPLSWKGYVFIFCWAIFSLLFTRLLFGNNSLGGIFFGFIVFLIGVFWAIHKKGEAPWDK